MSQLALLLVISMFALSESIIVVMTTRSFFLGYAALIMLGASLGMIVINGWLWIVHSEVLSDRQLEGICQMLRTMIRDPIGC